MVGDEVGVTCRNRALLPPSPATQMEDEDGDREDDEDVGDGEGSEDDIANSGAKTVEQERLRKKKRGGVDRHAEVCGREGENKERENVEVQSKKGKRGYQKN